MFSVMNKLLKVSGGTVQFVILLILRSPVDFTMTAMHAVFLQNAFNAIEQGDIGRLNAACIIFGITTLCVFLYNGTVWSVYAPFTVRIESKLRVKLFEKIACLPFERIEAAAHGDWLTRLNTDVQMPFSQPMHFPHAVNAILRLVISSVVLWRMDPTVFGWVMLFIAPHFITSQLLVARAMSALNKDSLVAMGTNTSALDAIITCSEAATLYDGHEYLIKRFELSSLALMRTKMKIHKRQAINAAIAIFPFGLGGYLALLIVSSGWIARGAMTFGDLTAAFQYRLGVLIGANMLINCIVSIKSSMAGISRINEIMYENVEGANG